METQVYNQKNERLENINLPDNIFGVAWQPDLVHFASVAKMANSRQPLAHTKTRGEVSGGGKKPWRQKGTGRARHGSTRSPIWAHGGVSHGPRNDKDYGKKINQKQKQLALFSLLSKRLTDNNLKIVDSLTLPAPKTKTIATTLKTLFPNFKSIAVITSKDNKAGRLSIRNISKTSLLSPVSLNVDDILNREKLLIEKGALHDLISVFNK